MIYKQLEFPEGIPMEESIFRELAAFDLEKLLFRGFNGDDKFSSMIQTGSDITEETGIFASGYTELSKIGFPANAQNPFRYAFGNIGSTGHIAVYDIHQLTLDPEIPFFWNFNNLDKKLDSLVAVFTLWN